jgi:hypothetical protein
MYCKVGRMVLTFIVAYFSVHLRKRTRGGKRDYVGMETSTGAGIN